MVDQASDFMRQSQAMAQQSWEQWMRYLQQASPQSSPQSGNPFAGSGAAGFGTSAGAPMNDVLERSLNGIKGYVDWMQRAAGSQFDPTATDWQAQMQQLFGQASQPFSQAFSGIDSTAAQGFVQQWQAWLAASGQGGTGDWQKYLQMPAFGLQREQQEQHQALIAALLDSAEQQRRYQALILRANAQGLERLQDKLAEHSEPGRQIDSLKGLYDLWIDAAEEAYAEIALSDEFSEVYGAMVNAQMHERKLMQQQLQDYCRQLGLPTRSEVDSIGRRLQEMRREVRASGSAGQASEVAALRAELAVLKRQLAGMRTAGAGGTSSVAAAAAPVALASAGRVEKRARVKKTAAAKAPARAKKVAKAVPVKKAAKVSKAAAVKKPAAAENATASKAPAKPRRALPTAPAARSEKSAKGRKKSASRVVAGGKAAVSPGFPAPRRSGRK